MRAVASGGGHKLRRSGSPPRGVAAHPLGVLLAASTPLFGLVTLCDPTGRAPDAAPHRLALIRWMFCWQVFTSIQAGASGDCLQASAGRGFGLPTPAEWTHSVSCWQSIPFYSASTLIQSCITLCDRRSLGPAATSRRGAAWHSSRLVCSEQFPPASDAG